MSEKLCLFLWVLLLSVLQTNIRVLLLSVTSRDGTSVVYETLQLSSLIFVLKRYVKLQLTDLQL